MDIMIKKLVPGIIALLCGVVFIIYRNSVVQLILTSHQKVWKETLKLAGDVGKFSKLFLNGLILFLGISLLMSGLIMVYQYFMSLSK